MKNKGRKANAQPTPERAVDRYFDQLDEKFTASNRAMYAIFLVLLLFGVQGLIWMIPFPQFEFLVNMKMHTFLNWGSFYVAIMIYLYLKLAPTLSYAMLFTVGVMAYFIVQLEYYERDGGLAVWAVAAVFAVVGLIGLVATAKRERAKLVPKDIWQLITIGPVWLWSKLFAKMNIKY